MLQEKTMYMNPATGSIALGDEWMAIFEEREDPQETWQAWGGDSLIEVALDQTLTWVEKSTLED